MICKLYYIHFKKNSSPEKPSLVFKAICILLTGETSHSGRRRGWFIVRPALHPLTEAHGPIRASICLSPDHTYPPQGGTGTHTPATQHWSNLAANQTEPNHAIASLTAFAPRWGRRFRSGPSRVMSKHRPLASASQGCADARDNHISLEMRSRSTAFRRETLIMHPRPSPAAPHPSAIPARWEESGLLVRSCLD